MSIQERDYYKSPHNFKQYKRDKKNILFLILVIIVILGLVLSLIPPIR